MGKATRLLRSTWATSATTAATTVRNDGSRTSLRDPAGAGADGRCSAGERCAFGSVTESVAANGAPRVSYDPDRFVVSGPE